jgi:hypothetical protein
MRRKKDEGVIPVTVGIEAAQDRSCKENAPEVYEKVPVAIF